MTRTARAKEAIFSHEHPSCGGKEKDTRVRAGKQAMQTLRQAVPRDQSLSHFASSNNRPTPPSITRERKGRQDDETSYTHGHGLLLPL